MGDFSNFGSLKSTETREVLAQRRGRQDFSNFGSLKSTETFVEQRNEPQTQDFSNFGSLKSTETPTRSDSRRVPLRISAISAR